MYLSSVEGPNGRERPLRRWDDLVKEYVSERGVRGNGLEGTRRKCMKKVTLQGKITTKIIESVELALESLLFEF